MILLTYQSFLPPLLFYYMLEIMNENIEISQLPHEHDDIFEEKGIKLPKIERMPSRGTQKQVRSTTKLPTIKLDPHPQAKERSTERAANTDEDFVGQVERKIRMVLEQQHIQELQESDQSDQDNFQRKIIENKQIIREAKRKNQRLKKENEHNNNVKVHLNLIRKISQGNRIETHQKRIRQSKQPASENTIQHKKKETLPQHPKKETGELKEVKNFNGALREFVSNKEISIRQAKSKEELTPLNKIIPNNSNRVELPEPKQLRKEYSQKNLTPIQKNEQLFDAIHNYLENPKRPEAEPLNPTKISKERADLQKKLRWYQEKINASACVEKQGLKHKLSLNSEQAESNRSDINNPGNNRWHKIGASQRGFFAQDNSSFDKEMDKINLYLQRNEKSLEKYLQNQKMLVDVQLASRRRSKDLKPYQLL